MSDEHPQPDWRDGVPQCSESCAHHDGKRCRLTGFRPDSICEPAVKQLSADVATPEERAVLEACANAEITPCTKILKGRSEWAIVKAELARRAAKEVKGG